MAWPVFPSSSFESNLFIKHFEKLSTNIKIWETKFTMEKRMKHHKKDVQFGRPLSAIVKHVMESGHEMDWERTTCLERETRTISRKLLEGCYIKANRNICMNLSNA